MLLVEFFMFLINGVILIHALYSTGIVRTMRAYIPIGLMAISIDNVVVLSGYLQYNSNYLLWLGKVPLAAGLTWGSIIYVLQLLRSSLNNHYGIRAAFLNPLLASVGTVFDAGIEHFTPSKILGWTWLIDNPILGFPIRNSIGWFLILGSILTIDDWVDKRFHSERLKLLVMSGLSLIQTTIVLFVLVCVGLFTKK